MHKVKFLTKNILEGDPEYRVVTDRTKEFSTFQGAIEFIRTIKASLSGREVLIGKPELEEA